VANVGFFEGVGKVNEGSKLQKDIRGLSYWFFCFLFGAMKFSKILELATSICQVDAVI